MQNTKIIPGILGILIIVVAIVIGLRKTAAPVVQEEKETRICAATDTMQCPDGSWIGRSGPDCQFVCPIGTSTPAEEEGSLIEAKVGQMATTLSVKVTPLTILEDSRCPIDVQCIQAGTVRVSALLESGLGSATQEFKLNTPVTTEAHTITLVAVRPEKESTKEVSVGSYSFVFKVSKR